MRSPPVNLKDKPDLNGEGRSPLRWLIGEERERGIREVMRVRKKRDCEEVKKKRDCEEVKKKRDHVRKKKEENS